MAGSLKKDFDDALLKSDDFRIRLAATHAVVASHFNGNSRRAWQFMHKRQRDMIDGKASHFTPVKVIAESIDGPEQVLSFVYKKWPKPSVH